MLPAGRGTGGCAKRSCYYRCMTEIGIAVDPSPAQRPQRIVLPGRVVTLRPFDGPSQAEALYVATHGPAREDLWRYMGDGPFSSYADYQAAFEKKQKSDDPLFWATWRTPRASRLARPLTCA